MAYSLGRAAIFRFVMVLTGLPLSPLLFFSRLHAIRRTRRSACSTGRDFACTGPSAGAWEGRREGRREGRNREGGMDEDVNACLDDGRVGRLVACLLWPDNDSSARACLGNVGRHVKGLWSWLHFQGPRPHLDSIPRFHPMFILPSSSFFSSFYSVSSLSSPFSSSSSSSSLLRSAPPHFAPSSTYPVCPSRNPYVPVLTAPSLPPSLPLSYKHVHRNPEEAPEEGEFNVSSQKAADEAAAAAAAAAATTAALAGGMELNSSLARGGPSGTLVLEPFFPPFFPPPPLSPPLPPSFFFLLCFPSTRLCGQGLPSLPLSIPLVLSSPHHQYFQNPPSSHPSIFLSPSFPPSLLSGNAGLSVVGGFGTGRGGAVTAGRERGAGAHLQQQQQLQLLALQQQQLQQQQVQQQQQQQQQQEPGGPPFGVGAGPGRDGGRDGGRDRRPGGALERNENYKTTLCNHWLSNKVRGREGGGEGGREGGGLTCPAETRLGQTSTYSPNTTLLPSLPPLHFTGSVSVRRGLRICPRRGRITEAPSGHRARAAAGTPGRGGRTR